MQPPKEFGVPELKELFDTVEGLRDALSGRDELLSIATHELKSPLTSMKLLLQVMGKLAQKQDTIASSNVLHMLEPLHRQVDRLTKLTDNLLDLSRIRHGGGLTLDLETFNLSSALQDVVARLKPQAEWMGSALTLEAASDVYGCWDRFRLEQVATNLITNAIKYGPGKPIRVLVSQTHQIAEFSVQDEGIGISKADQQRIFKRFERASHEHRTQSLGLGLYIVREIMTAHQGWVEVVSELGRGSVFTAKLPLNLDFERAMQ